MEELFEPRLPAVDIQMYFTRQTDRNEDFTLFPNTNANLILELLVAEIKAFAWLSAAFYSPHLKRPIRREEQMLWDAKEYTRDKIIAMLKEEPFLQSYMVAYAARYFEDSLGSHFPSPRLSFSAYPATAWPVR